MYNHLVKLSHICGTGKQQVPRKFSARKKGTGWALAELENSKCQGSTPENFVAAEQTGSSLREKRELDGHLRNWNRRIVLW